MAAWPRGRRRGALCLPSVSERSASDPSRRARSRQLRRHRTLRSRLFPRQALDRPGRPARTGSKAQFPRDAFAGNENEVSYAAAASAIRRTAQRPCTDYVEGSKPERVRSCRSEPGLRAELPSGRLHRRHRPVRRRVATVQEFDEAVYGLPRELLGAVGCRRRFGRTSAHLLDQTCR